MTNIETSIDKTVKFNFSEGYSSVLIPLNDKKTLCLSSQIGCPMKCGFCISGKRTFERNLTLDELKEQLTEAIKYLKLIDIKSKENKNEKNYLAENITSIVFMGMGEPLLNLKTVLEFCDYVNEFYGYSYSKILISTSGIISKMEEVINNPNKIQLAISLHSTNQQVRDKMMPASNCHKISELIKTCNYYNEKYRQKIMIEYLMIKGLNDSDEDLQGILDLNLAKRTNFNLIPLNGSFELEGKIYESSTKETMSHFRNELMKAGYKCFTRTSMGADIEAACGMIK
ncbi:radical SAM protein [Candidatus Pacearchaeota archaeon]|nr:radical SAM protein [Candidatus Pacearchaeota archaeon]